MLSLRQDTGKIFGKFTWCRSKTDDIEKKDNQEELMAESEMGLPNSPEIIMILVWLMMKARTMFTLEDDWVSSDEESGTRKMTDRLMIM